jgi:hypothetical protein
MANGIGIDALVGPNGKNKFASPTGYGTSLADDQAGGFGDLLANMLNRRRVGATAAGGPAWSPAASGGGAGSTPLGTPGTQTNPNNQYSLLKLSKDPSGRYDNLNGQALDSIDKFNPDYSNYRNSIKSFLNDNDEKSYQSDRSDIRNSTNDYISRIQSQTPVIEGQTAKQSAALDRYYLDQNDLNSVYAQLGRQNQALTFNEKRLANRAAGQAMLKSRLANAGGGNSSYANAQLADLSGQIAERAAVRGSERSREDTNNVLGAQQRLAGRSQEMMRKDLELHQLPTEAKEQLLANVARSTAARLQNTGQAVTIDQLTDALSATGRKLGLTGQALQNYLAQNFFGVNKQGQDYPLVLNDYNPRGFNGPGGYGGGGGNGGYQRPQDSSVGSLDWIKQQRMKERYQNGTTDNLSNGGDGWGITGDPQTGNFSGSLNGDRVNAHDGIYDLNNDFSSYGDPRIKNFAPALYRPGYDAAKNASLNNYYENPEDYGNPENY